MFISRPTYLKQVFSQAHTSSFRSSKSTAMVDVL